MNLDRVKKFKQYLEDKYDEYDGADDEIRAIMDEYARERDTLLEKIESMELQHRELIAHYQEMVEVWKSQALESAKALTEIIGAIKNKVGIEL